MEGGGEGEGREGRKGGGGRREVRGARASDRENVCPREEGGEGEGEER